MQLASIDKYSHMTERIELKKESLMLPCFSLYTPPYFGSQAGHRQRPSAASSTPDSLHFVTKCHFVRFLPICVLLAASAEATHVPTDTPDTPLPLRACFLQLALPFLVKRPHFLLG